MTPKEKAIELVGLYAEAGYRWHLQNPEDGIRMRQVLECALITVNEILKIAEPSTEQVQYANGEWAREYREIPNRYWTEVKQEIENF